MRQPWWEWGIWIYRVSVAQANGAGGAIILDFAPIGGTTMIIIKAEAINSGTNAVRMERTDADNNRCTRLLDITSGVGAQGSIPRTYTATTTSVTIDSTPMETRLFRSEDKFTIRQTVAGSQDDTIMIALRAFLSSAERPIVTKARSTNPSDVTIAAPTINVIR